MKLRECKRKGGITYFLDYYSGEKRIRERLPRGTDRRTAEAFRASRELEIAKGAAGLPKRANVALSDILDELIKQRTADCVPGHIKRLEIHKAQLEEFFGASLPLKSLDPALVNEYKAGLRADGQAPSTINRKIALLKAAAALAVRRGYIAKNPIGDVSRLSDPSREKARFLTAEEAERLLVVLKDGAMVKVERGGIRGNYETLLGKNQRLFELVAALLNTGGRLSEVLGLLWKDVDLKRGFVEILTTKHAARGRRAKIRRVPLNQTMKELFEAMKKRDKPAPSDPVFTVSADNLRRRFVRACKLADLGHVRIHDLRHSAASLMVSAGVPLHVVKEILGHSTITTTMIYSHLAPDAMSKATDALNLGGAAKTAKIIPVGKEKTA
jgi:integrase